MAKPRKTETNPYQLTPKQMKFKDIYIQTGNGAQAVREAYPNVSEDVAKVVASENLTKTNVQAAILADLARSPLNIETILKELQRDIHHPLPVIRTKTLELLGKHFKMFTDKVDHTHALEKVTKIGWDTGEDDKD